MYDVDEDPLSWALEFVICQIVVFILQLIAGILTVKISNTNLTIFQKYICLSLCLLFISYLSYLTFDPNTHLMGSMIAGLSLAFITPLQASSYIHQTHNSPYTKLKYEAIIRIAIPAADPTPTRKPQNPVTQFIKGCLFFTAMVPFTPIASRVIEMDIKLLTTLTAFIALRLMADGALNLISCVRGFLGVSASDPFNSPLNSTSQSSFWAFRWNTPVSQALRDGIAIPLIHNLGLHPGIANYACFLASGASHEFILWFAGIYGSKGEWFLFFVMAGFTTALEKLFLSGAKFKFWKMVFGWFAIVLLFHTLFVPVTVRTGLAQTGLKTFGDGVTVIRALYKFVFGGR